MKIPTSRSPIVDSSGEFAHEGQEGPVFFLAGNNTGGTTERTVTLPCGKHIFFPIVNASASAEVDPCNTCEECKARLKNNIDSTSILECEIDGAAASPDLFEHREASSCFTAVVPEDNPWGIPGGTFDDSASDGYWLMLPPFCPGYHTVHFKGVQGPPESPTFSLEVTYYLTAEACPDFLRGDGNDDGKADISDAVFALNFLFLGGGAPSCPDAADADDDGALNITDPIFLLNFLFLGGKEPPAPGPRTPGPDPTTGDDLGPCDCSSC